MARSKWISFGTQHIVDHTAKSQSGAIPTSSSAPQPSPADAKKFGLENFANICYANSVLQTLYFCAPFRDLLLQDTGNTLYSNTSPPASLPPRKSERKVEQSSSAPHGGVPIPLSPPTLYSALQSLFLHISTSPGNKGTVAPRAFIDKLKELNELFRSTMHQDAHEFLNYLLNQIVEEIEIERRRAATKEDLSDSTQTFSSKVGPTINGLKSESSTSEASLVHKLFEGVLTSETRCLTCETVSCRDESFLDLSVDIEQNSSLTACLRQFSASEMLCQKNKFFCDSCCDLQEAEKRMKIKKLPNVLALHLKRFKYQEDVGRYIKLTYRVAFPLELRLFNTVDDLDDADRLYDLFAIVVHIGNGPHHGHYISIIKTIKSWFIFDDDNVSQIPESDIHRYFGDSNSGSAYILYYQAVDIDLLHLGLRAPDPPQNTETSTVIQLDRQPNTTQHSPAVHSDSVSTADLVSFPRLPEDPPVPVTPGSLVIPPISDSTPRQTSPNTPSVTPTSLGRQIMNTIRRAPSMSATRPSASPGLNGSDKRSMADKSPRLSASLAGFIDTPHEIPPVPPLPPGVLTNPMSSPSLLITEPLGDDKGKEKDKSKVGGKWFRKSLRLGDKGSKSEAPPPPVAVDDGTPHTSGWFNRSNSSTGVSKFRQASRIGTGSDVADSNLFSSRRGSSAQDRGMEDLSLQSHASSSSLPIPDPDFMAGAMQSAPSTPNSVNPTQQPTRNGPSTSSLERARSSVERKRKRSFSNPLHITLSTSQSALDHPLPPLPPDIHHLSPSNNNLPLANSNPTFTDEFAHPDSSPLPSVAPMSWGSTLSSSFLSVAEDSQDNHFPDKYRSPARKLTAPILAFANRKDREREKRSIL